MPIAQSELLFKLINSLNQSEKRHFRLYVNRLESNQGGKFIQLFDLLDKKSSLDDEAIIAKLKLKSSNQYSNLKRHLYAQILKSLRLTHISKNTSIRIRENLDYALLLYGKGLFQQSLLILERAKAWAKDAGRSMIYLEILELQKKIESRHITRSRKIKDHIEKLISESAEMRRSISATSEISDLSLNMQGLYIKFGFVRNDRDALLIESFFNSHQPSTDITSASLYAKVLWCQCLVWYHYMRLEFEESRKSALQWTNYFEENPTAIEADPDLYMRGMHYALTCSFYLHEPGAFRNIFNKYNAFRTENASAFNNNSIILDFNYYYNAQINYVFLTGHYKDAPSLIVEINDKLHKYQKHMDAHRTHVFYYKIALLHLYMANYTESLDYITKILNSSTDILKPDLFCYTRFLQLICHYNLSNFTLVEHMVGSVRNTFNSYSHNNELMDLMFVFLRKACKAMNFGLKNEINSLKEKIDVIQSDSYSKVSFQYFDFHGWLSSLQKNTSIQKI